jgi:valyl-tRNA synthetase
MIVIKYFIHEVFLLYRFIKCEDMAKHAMSAVTSGKLIIDPPAFHKVWFDWLGNIR